MAATVAVSQGMIRIGILLSIIWIAAVAAFVVMEGQHRNGLCAITPKGPGCKRHFWAWETPPGAKPAAEAVDEKPAEGEKPRGILARKLAEAINKQVDKIESREFRLKPARVAGAIFGPLALFWALGFGVAWCVAGFRPKK